jgi:hypothetical protein
MARPHIEFLRAQDVLVKRVETGVLAGASQRLMSRDDETDAYTVLATLPAGWSSDGKTSGQFEFYVVRGELSVGAAPCGPGSYVNVPGGQQDRALVSETGALVMFFFGVAGDTEGPVEILDTDRMLWSNPAAELDGGAGICQKLLRTDPVTGDSTWLAGICPGWYLTQAETHPVAQEVFMLSGGVDLGQDRGAFMAGSYFWRTPQIHHGPLISREGALILMRSFTDDFTVDWHDVPGYEKDHADFLAANPLLPDL